MNKFKLCLIFIVLLFGINAVLAHCPHDCSSEEDAVIAAQLELNSAAIDLYAAYENFETVAADPSSTEQDIADAMDLINSCEAAFSAAQNALDSAQSALASCQNNTSGHPCCP